MYPSLTSFIVASQIPVYCEKPYSALKRPEIDIIYCGVTEVTLSSPNTTIKSALGYFVA